MKCCESNLFCCEIHSIGIFRHVSLSNPVPPESSYYIGQYNTKYKAKNNKPTNCDLSQVYRLVALHLTRLSLFFSALITFIIFISNQSLIEQQCADC